MQAPDEAVHVVAVAAGPERSSRQPTKPGPEHHKLDVFIGKWINEGHTVAAPSLPILTSDVYEWAPGGFFVAHFAYGRIGDIDVGAIEMIAYDAEAGSYRSRLFDSQGNESVSRLTERDGVWRWSGARTRCTATFSDDGKIQTAHHERSSDGLTWEPSMEVALRRIR